jgi:O-methyltransferase involved in polyketide biosynthesis
MHKVDISVLRAVPETLLIPLAARMIAAERHPDLGFHDSEACRIGKEIGFDPVRFSDDAGSMRGAVARALWFDRVVSAFIRANPDGLCVSIGSGLDDRPARIRLPTNGIDWFDVEFPEVARLRTALIAPRANVQCLVVDNADPDGWLASSPWRNGRRTLVLAEGVLMYFAPADGERFLRRLVEAARTRSASLDLVADFATPIMVRNSHRHPSVRQTGARFAWAVARPQDVTAIAPGLALIEEADIARRAGLMTRVVSWLFRFITGRPAYFAAHYRLSLGR